MTATVPTVEEFDALAARVTALENAEPPPEPGPEPIPESDVPASFVTAQQLEDIKEEIATNPSGIHARLYADMLANGKPNGNGWRTSETRKLYADPGYTAAPAHVAEDHIEFSYPGTFPTTFGHDAYGQNFTDDCTAMLTLAIRSHLDADPDIAEACAVAAINCLAVWVDKLSYVDSQWDNNLATGKLWWAWGWQQLGPALTLLWDHPTFSADLKADLAEWCWVVGMDKHTGATSQGIVYDPEDGHWIRSRTYKSTATPPPGSGITDEATPSPGVTGEGNLLCEVGGSNHTLTYWMARLHHGLIIGGETGQAIVDAVISDFRDIVRSVIYFTGDAHHILGAGWPVSAQPPGWPKPSAYDSAKEMAEYWFEEESKWTPFDGIGQEMGRDRGHHRMSQLRHPFHLRHVDERRPGRLVLHRGLGRAQLGRADGGNRGVRLGHLPGGHRSGRPGLRQRHRWRPLVERVDARGHLHRDQLGGGEHGHQRRRDRWVRQPAPYVDVRRHVSRSGHSHGRLLPAPPAGPPHAEHRGAGATPRRRRWGRADQGRQPVHVGSPTVHAGRLGGEVR